MSKGLAAFALREVAVVESPVTSLNLPMRGEERETLTCLRLPEGARHPRPLRPPALTSWRQHYSTSRPF